MGEITKVAIDVLKVHPRNLEFFDDIAGDDYEKFKSSIKEDGIISEIIVSPDMTILSGHQRFKAAVDLGFKTVPVRIREDIETEDQKLKILLAANFGRKENSKAKDRKVADEYVRLCGYGSSRPKGDRQNGSDQKLTLAEIAKQLNTNERSLSRSLRIERNLSEDMKLLLDDGVITETFAADVIAGMSEDEQLALISKLDVTKKYTAKELQRVIDENSLLKTENENLKRPGVTTQREKFEKNRADRLQTENENLKTQLEQLTKTKKIETVEIIPEDYDDLRKQVAELTNNNEALRKENNGLKAEMSIPSLGEKDYGDLRNKYNDLLSRYQTLEDAFTNTQEDNERLRQSMPSTASYAVGTGTILNSFSRAASVIKNELTPLIYNSELDEASDAMISYVDEQIDNFMQILQDIRHKVHSGKVKDIIDVC